MSMTYDIQGDEADSVFCGITVHVACLCALMLSLLPLVIQVGRAMNTRNDRLLTARCSGFSSGPSCGNSYCRARDTSSTCPSALTMHPALGRSRAQERVQGEHEATDITGRGMQNENGPLVRAQFANGVGARPDCDRRVKPNRCASLYLSVCYAITTFLTLQRLHSQYPGRFRCSVLAVARSCLRYVRSAGCFGALQSCHPHTNRSQ